MSRQHDTLFRSFRFGNIELGNRVVMAPMTRSQSPGNVPTDDVVEYYRRRAAAQVGLIVTEGTAVGHKASHGYPDVPDFFGDDALAGWKKVVDAVHAEGGAIVPQLWHVGSIRQPDMPPDPKVPGYGPSPVPHPFYEGKGQPPVEMTQADIDEAVAAYGASAGYAKTLGFDGVEIHGAHSYLIDQFFWSTTNERTDGYGGDLVQRTRFAVEVIRAVREAVGPDFPVILRFSQWKMGAYDEKLAQTPDELAAFLAPLVDAGVDLFHCSTRRFWIPEFDGSDLNLAGWTKKLTGKPTITVGSVGLDGDFLRSFAGKETSPASIEKLLERLERDEFDLVAVGRQILADPEWLLKIRDGREDEIVNFSPEKLLLFP